MNNFGKRLFSQDRESTASIVSRELLSNGILGADITSGDIMHVYSSLKKIRNAADFTSIGKTLPNQGEKTINNLSPIWGVIVETREHPELEFVLNNFIKNVQIPIQIFHGNNNLDFIMSTTIAELVRDGKVHLTRLNTNKLCAKRYNALLLSKGFWRSILGRKKILIFQTDAVSCKHSDYTINDFVSYDYIGSNWNQNRPVGLIIDGGNGGLSLRDWGKSHECLSRFPPEQWYGGEDGYFAFHVELIGGKVGKGDECSKFSTQREFLFKSWGAHKVSSLSKRDQYAFLSYCPAANFMLGENNNGNQP